MRHPIRLALLALTAVPGAALAAAGAVNDFRLPQGDATAQPVPERQGPVAPDVPESQAPRPTVPSPRPTPSAPPVRAAVTPRPTITPPAPKRPAATPAAVAVPTPTSAPPVSLSVPQAEPTSAPSAQPLPHPLPAPRLPPVQAGNPQWVPWALTGAVGLAALLAAAGLAWLFLRRRIGRGGPAQAPLLERPSAAPAPPPPPLDPLQVTLVPVRMSLTLVNAVLTWQAELANHGSVPLAGLAITADMISAHADLSVDERRSGPAAGADSLPLGPLLPGERRLAGGEIRLPFPHIVPIWHGEIALLMPLLRLRIAADGIMPVTRIFLVGQPSPTDPATLQPFRLDLGPRVYPDLAQRAFA